MTKPTNTVSKKQIRIAMLVIAALAFLLGGVYWILEARNQNQTKELQLTIQLARNTYKIEHLQFCFDSQLTPCTDENISSYNSKNPDASFNLLSEQAITENAIRDVKILNNRQ